VSRDGVAVTCGCQVNELRLSVVQQQRYIMRLEDSVRQLQERNLLLLNGAAQRANETGDTQVRPARALLALRMQIVVIITFL